jgi:(1->4)-alpha-D-glucan 1-alpha-D-glucosylmutase
VSRLLATYRIQLREGTSLRTARDLVPYLAQLGASHLYLSPVLRARSGSTHGYDVVDTDAVDPALGGERELERLAETCRAHGLGILLDIVPNHMAAAPENAAFEDVLTHGPASRFARWFDVEWGDPERHDPLLLPVLEAPIGDVVAREEVGLERAGGVVRVRIGDASWPLDPATLPDALASAVGVLRTVRAAPAARELEMRVGTLRQIPPRAAAEVGKRAAQADAALAALGDLLERSEPTRLAADEALAGFGAGPAGHRRLTRFLRRQAYRLGEWRSASRRLNYRRFFDVDDLIGVRVEDSEVFAETHSRVLEFVARGWIDGLRVDHVDGLLDPQVYLERLRGAVAARRGSESPPFALLVEKILAADETLPESWPVEGTTGYEFLNQLEAILLEPAGARAIERGWSHLCRRRRGWAQTARETKRRVLFELLRADLERLAGELVAIAAEDGAALSAREARSALAATIARLDVYRTYADAQGTLVEADRRRLDAALAGAAEDAPGPALEGLARILRSAGTAVLAPDSRARRIRFLQHFQQLSGPAAAKGIEDTAFYVHVPLLSLNEVGGDPGAPLEGAVARLHEANAERARRWPSSLLAVTTHDTKRSADVRARLDVLSEIPQRWLDWVARWHGAHGALRRRLGSRLAPDLNTVYLLYQTLVGIWPPQAPHARALPAADVLVRLRERVVAYLLKAVREADVETSWVDPNARFEEATRAFAEAILDPTTVSGAHFLRELVELVAEVSRPGLWNGLTRTVVQIGAPGVPDLYQGDELWSLSLVDPDNRRPVDFDLRRRRLRKIEERFALDAVHRAAFLHELVTGPEDGRLELHVIRCALRARRRHPDLLGGGDYLPLAARGERARHVFAFARRAGSQWAVVAVPRLPRTLVGDPERVPVGSTVWGDSVLPLPAELTARPLECALTGFAVRPERTPDGAELPLAEVFSRLPAALLVAR